MDLSMFPPGTDFSKIPSGIPPPGITSNLINPPSIAYEYISTASIVLALTIACVAFRLYIRLAVTKSAGWDDFTIAVATVVQTAYTGTVIGATQYGVGRHIWDVPISWAAQFIKLSQVAATTIEPSIYFTKLSILILYLRIFHIDVATRYGIYAGMVFCTIFYTTAMFLYIFVTNLDAEVKVNYAVAVINVVSDFYILALPIIAVSKLQLEFGKKLGVLAIFLTGLLACGLSLAGCVYRFNFSYDVTADTTWALIPVFIVNTVEVDVGIICACLPVFPSFFRKGTSPAESTSRWLSSLRSMMTFSRSSSQPTTRKQGDRSDSDATLTQHSIGSRPSAFDGIRRQKTMGSTYLELDEEEVWRKNITTDGYGLRPDGTARARDGSLVQGHMFEMAGTPRGNQDDGKGGIWTGPDGVQQGTKRWEWEIQPAKEKSASRGSSDTEVDNDVV